MNKVPKAVKRGVVFVLLCCAGAVQAEPTVSVERLEPQFCHPEDPPTLNEYRPQNACFRLVTQGYHEDRENPLQVKVRATKRFKNGSVDTCTRAGPSYPHTLYCENDTYRTPNWERKECYTPAPAFTTPYLPVVAFSLATKFSVYCSEGAEVDVELLPPEPGAGYSLTPSLRAPPTLTLRTEKCDSFTDGECDAWETFTDNILDEGEWLRFLVVAEPSPEHTYAAFLVVNTDGDYFLDGNPSRDGMDALIKIPPSILPEKFGWPEITSYNTVVDERMRDGKRVTVYSKTPNFRSAHRECGNSRPDQPYHKWEGTFDPPCGGMKGTMVDGERDENGNVRNFDQYEIAKAINDGQPGLVLRTAYSDVDEADGTVTARIECRGGCRIDRREAAVTVRRSVKPKALVSSVEPSSVHEGDSAVFTVKMNPPTEVAGVKLRFTDVGGRGAKYKKGTEGGPFVAVEAEGSSEATFSIAEEGTSFLVETVNTGPYEEPGSVFVEVVDESEDNDYELSDEASASVEVKDDIWIDPGFVLIHHGHDYLDWDNDYPGATSYRVHTRNVVDSQGVLSPGEFEACPRGTRQNTTCGIHSFNPHLRRRDWPYANPRDPSWQQAGAETVQVVARVGNRDIKTRWWHKCSSRHVLVNPPPNDANYVGAYSDHYWPPPDCRSHPLMAMSVSKESITEGDDELYVNLTTTPPVRNRTIKAKLRFVENGDFGAEVEIVNSVGSNGQKNRISDSEDNEYETDLITLTTGNAGRARLKITTENDRVFEQDGSITITLLDGEGYGLPEETELTVDVRSDEDWTRPNLRTESYWVDNGDGTITGPFHRARWAGFLGAASYRYEISKPTQFASTGFQDAPTDPVVHMKLDRQLNEGQTTDANIDGFTFRVEALDADGARLAISDWWHTCHPKNHVMTNPAPTANGGAYSNDQNTVPSCFQRVLWATPNLQVVDGGSWNSRRIVWDAFIDRSPFGYVASGYVLEAVNERPRRYTWTTDANNRSATMWERSSDGRSLPVAHTVRVKALLTNGGETEWSDWFHTCRPPKVAAGITQGTGVVSTDVNAHPGCEDGLPLLVMETDAPDSMIEGGSFTFTLRTESPRIPIASVGSSLEIQASGGNFNAEVCLEDSCTDIPSSRATRMPLRASASGVTYTVRTKNDGTSVADGYLIVSLQPNSAYRLPADGAESFRVGINDNDAWSYDFQVVDGGGPNNRFIRWSPFPDPNGNLVADYYKTVENADFGVSNRPVWQNGESLEHSMPLFKDGHETGSYQELANPAFSIRLRVPFNDEVRQEWSEWWHTCRPPYALMGREDEVGFYSSRADHHPGCGMPSWPDPGLRIVVDSVPRERPFAHVHWQPYLKKEYNGLNYKVQFIRSIPGGLDLYESGFLGKEGLTAPINDISSGIVMRVRAEVEVDKETNQGVAIPSEWSPWWFTCNPAHPAKNLIGYSRGTNGVHLPVNTENISVIWNQIHPGCSSISGRGQTEEPTESIGWADPQFEVNADTNPPQIEWREFPNAAGYTADFMRPVNWTGRKDNGYAEMHNEGPEYTMRVKAHFDDGSETEWTDWFNTCRPPYEHQGSDGDSPDCVEPPTEDESEPPVEVVLPEADAGRDVEAQPNDSVTLGEDEANEDWEYVWEQVRGPEVEIADGDQPQMVFTVPADMADGVEFRFELTIIDKETEDDDTDSVSVTVNRPASQCHTDLGQFGVDDSYISGTHEHWDNEGCRAHHKTNRMARYFRLELTERAALDVGITRLDATGALMFVSRGEPQNGWGTVPNADMDHRIKVRLENGKLVHEEELTASVVLEPDRYTVEAVLDGNVDAHRVASFELGFSLSDAPESDAQPMMDMGPLKPAWLHGVAGQ